MSYATFSFILRIRTSQPGRIPEWNYRGVREGVPVRNDKVTLMTVPAKGRDEKQK